MNYNTLVNGDYTGVELLTPAPTANKRYFIAGNSLNDADNLDQVWVAEYDNRVIRVSNQDNPAMDVINIAGLDDFDVCVDRFGKLVVTYTLAGVCYIRYFKKSLNQNVTINVSQSAGGLITTPRLALENPNKTKFDEWGVILGYFIDTNLIVRKLDTSLSTGQVITTLTNPGYLDQIAFGSDNRLHYSIYTLAS